MQIYARILDEYGCYIQINTFSYGNQMMDLLVFK